ncbi:MAG TPA: C-terminal binding protein [bacterium]|nr:C-terminal binding protein [bacterium]
MPEVKCHRMGHAVLITDHDFPDLEPEERILRPMGVQLEVLKSSDRPTLRSALGRADAVINQTVALDAEMIAAMPRCLLIVRYGVGYDGVDIEAATRAGICVANVPDYGTQEVALHAVALLLAVHRRLLQYDSALRQGRWLKGPDVVPPVPRLKGLTLGIVGFGRIGRIVSGYAEPFGLHRLTYDPYISRSAAIEGGAVLVDYQTLLRQSDFVTFHTPLSTETQHLLGPTEIALMKPTAILINTSRGAVIDTAALARALQTGKLAGAGIDVFEQEPLKASHPLRTAPNALLTPHVAWYSEEAKLTLKRRVAEEVARALQGEWPRSLVNPEVRGSARLRSRGKSPEPSG